MASLSPTLASSVPWLKLAVSNAAFQDGEGCLMATIRKRERSSYRFDNQVQEH